MSVVIFTMSLSNLSNIWRIHFTNKGITENTYFAKCDECCDLSLKLREAIDLTIIKYLDQVKKFHNDYIKSSCATHDSNIRNA